MDAPLKTISMFQPSAAKKAPGSERAELIGFFTDNLNAARVGTRWKPLSPAAVAAKVAHLSLADLYYFKSVCVDAERRGFGFSKAFWCELRVKKGA